MSSSIVTVSCPSPSLQSFEQDGRSKDSDRGQIQRAASAIIGALSKRHNSTVMLAVVEVKVETQVESPPIGESKVPGVLFQCVKDKRQGRGCRFWGTFVWQVDKGGKEFCFNIIMVFRFAKTPGFGNALGFKCLISNSEQNCVFSYFSNLCTKLQRGDETDQTSNHAITNKCLKLMVPYYAQVTLPMCSDDNLCLAC